MWKMKKNNLICLGVTLCLFSCNTEKHDNGDMKKEKHKTVKNVHKVSKKIESTLSKATTYEEINDNLSDLEVVSIGGEMWCTKNLNTNVYRNGDIIPQVQDIDKWNELTTGAWCYISEDSNYGKKYGKLYNWFAVHDPRGLAPEGFKIPSELDWYRLIESLGGKENAGKKMKASSQFKNDEGSTNSSGFYGLPAGSRGIGSPFDIVGGSGQWWNSTIGTEIEGTRFFEGRANPLGKYYFSLSELDEVGTYFVNGKGALNRYGLSVRCIKE